jgi:hypothetical protein
VFTGQTEYCNGSPAASAAEIVAVAYPAVQVRCPKRAGRTGCRFKLTAVTKRRKGKAMAPVAKGKAKAGKSTLVSLKPKMKFAARLATARDVLVRESLAFGGRVVKRVIRLKIAPPG